MGRMLLALVLSFAGGAAVSADVAGQHASVAPSKTVPAKPLTLRGTLGDVRVQMDLRPKADMADGWEGSYFLFGHSAVILLAGELDGGELALEESENGTDVSGQWNGKLGGGSLSGEWTSFDGSIVKPFNLKIMPKAEKTVIKTGNQSQ